MAREGGGPIDGGIAVDELVDRLRSAYPRSAAQLLPALLQVLLEARNACGGDIEAFIIALSVALRTVDQPVFRELSYAQLIAGFDQVKLGLGTNVQSIADSTGIPKETVRRKVSSLETDGVILRRGHLLYCAPKAFGAFMPVREALLQLVARGCRVAETADEKDAQAAAR
jgi:hypothetical protein